MEPAPQGLLSALTCLVVVARHHGMTLSLERLLHDYAVVPEAEPVPLLRRIGRDIGLNVKEAALAWNEFAGLGGALPALLRLDDGRWVVLSGFRPTAGGGEVVIRDLARPAEGFVFLDREAFRRKSSGAVVFVKPTVRSSVFADAHGLMRFWPEILRQRRLFRDVAIAVLLMQVLGLAMPMMFQIVVDKVLVHAAYSTLTVLVIGVSIATALEALLRFLNRYILLHATTKIDARVVAASFLHLLSLPIDFFERTANGVLVKHMQQTEKIRQFLTGRLFLTLLDAVSLVVVVPVLFLYSPALTLVVLVGTGAIIVVVAAVSVPFRRLLKSLYEAEGARQALLVESIQGMQTIKSLTLEPVRQRRWEGNTAGSILLQFRVGSLASMGQAVTSLIERAVQIVVIAWGAGGVIDGTLTVGTLVAFQILATRVSGPMVQLATLVQEYQEIALAARMLGAVLDQAPERPPGRLGSRPEIAGRVEFDNVTFRYPAGNQPVLRKLSFVIPAGRIFGIVGRSGSGKSTLAKLIVGFYAAQEGVVRLDRQDVREIDLVHLRSRVGVVLQENFLFHGTVRDNIAAARVAADMSEVIEAARLAGALEFIERLPRGFDSVVEENGFNLSGGQRQRLAIARALISRPRLLLFDEATSALDPESEAIVNANLKAIAAGRTLVVISHRLASHVGADNILVLEEGEAVALGRHDDLLQGCDLYRRLWSQQMGWRWASTG